MCLTDKIDRGCVIHVNDEAKHGRCDGTEIRSLMF